MAHIGDICVLIGNAEWFIGDSEGAIPTAIVLPDVQTTILHGVARFDASGSYSDDELDTLRYVWRVVSTPLHSNVIIGTDESLVLEDNGVVAYLSVDVVGIYEVELIVIGANGGCSEPATANVTATRSYAPLTDQTALDSSWIWELLPDVWTALNDDKPKIEALWRGFAQTISSDVLNLYNVNADKSIATIQEQVYRRWLSVRPRLDLPEKTYIVLHEYKEYESEVIDEGNLFSGSLKFRQSLLPDLVQSYQGVGIITGPHEIFASPSPLICEIGDTIVVTIDNVEKFYSIGGVSFQNSSFLIPGQVLEAPYFPYEVSYKVIPKRDIYLSALVDGKSVTPYEYIDRVEGNHPRNFVLKIAEHKVIPKEKVTCILASSLLSDIDFEELGVRPGDVLIGEIGNRQFTTTTTVKATVVSVEGRRLSFKFDDVEKWATQTNIQRYSDQLGVSTVITELDGSLSITGNADIVQSIFNSPRFRNRYFNRPITQQDTLVLGTLAFRIRPLFILRNSLVPISDDINAFLNLVEYIEKPHLSEDGLTLLGLDNSEMTLDRPPLSLMENRDYILSDSTFWGNNLKGLANSSFVENAQGGFLDHNVSPQDILQIKNGFSRGEYQILEVEQDKLQVFPVIPNAFDNATYRIIKKKDIKYLRFLNIFTPDSPAPELLWSETAILSNNKTIEENFGSILRLPLEEWERRNLPASYKATVLGLLRARMLGATVNAMESSTNILCGLPFVDRRGVIREIEFDYLVDSQTGEALVTKILIEDLDSLGVETGVLHAHYIRALNDEGDPDFTGIAFNPRTGLRYAIGDQIYENEVLSLGVKIRDRLYSSNYAVPGIQQFHTFRVMVNALNTSIDRRGVFYLHDFLVEIKPHYTHILLAFYLYLMDKIEIEDEIFFKIRTRLFDNAMHVNFGAEIHDEFLAGFGRNDEAMAMIRTPWRATDLTFTASNQVESLHGGFITPPENIFNDGPAVANAEIQGPDYLWIQNGPWANRYVVTGVISDTVLEVATLETLEDPNFLVGSGPYRFKVTRPDRELLLEALIDTNDGSPDFIKIPNFPFWSYGIGNGDTITFDTQNAITHTVVNVLQSVEDSYYDTLQIDPPLLLDGSFTMRVWRRSALLRTRLEDVSIVVLPGDLKCKIQVNNTDIENVPSYIIEPGDVLIKDGIEHLIVGTTNGKFFHINPTILAGTYEGIAIKRRQGLEVLDALDQNLKQIDDPLIFKIRSSSSPLLCDPWQGTRVILQGAHVVGRYNIVPGDIIRILEGTMSTVDVGEGPGIFRITGPSNMDNAVDINASIPLDESNIEYEIWKLIPNRQIYWKDPN